MRAIIDCFATACGSVRYQRRPVFIINTESKSNLSLPAK